jgi:hypothetical protein
VYQLNTLGCALITCKEYHSNLEKKAKAIILMFLIKLRF